MEHKRAVIYCRVSTKEQVEEGNSLATQEKICKEYAVKHGYEIVQSFIELGESAKTADRTELKKLLAFCTSKKEKIEAVIIYRVDRLSRQVEDYTFIKSKLRQSGVTIKSTAEHFEDDPAGRFMENIIANVAQFDNDVRTERSVNGMKDAVREGRYVWLAPIGYKNVKINGKSNIVPTDDAVIIKEIFSEIARNKLPIDTVWKQINLKWSAGEKLKFNRSYFYRLLQNELYSGWITKFGERHKGCFEPLLSEELFNEVQYIIGTRKKQNIGYKRNHPDFPLRKFFFHPCGHGLTGGWSKGKYKKYPYYFYHLPKSLFPKESLETKFVSLLNEYSINKVFWSRLVTYTKKHLSQIQQTKKQSITDYATRIEALKQKQHILIDKNLSGILPDDLLKKELSIIEIELKEVEYLSKKEIQDVASDSIIPLLNEFVELPGETWKRANYKGKIMLQWFYFPKGVIYDGSEFRTPKTCCLFKLKELFMLEKSPDVHHQNFTLDTPQIAKSPIDAQNSIPDKVYFDKVQLELISLNNIKEKICDENN